MSNSQRIGNLLDIDGIQVTEYRIWCQDCHKVHSINDKCSSEKIAEVLKCDDCDLPYANFGMDTTIPNSQWNLIYSGEGVLCANCMVKRASKLPGVIAARLVFEFVPGNGKV